jgi:hypothetical protein
MTSAHRGVDVAPDGERQAKPKRRIRERWAEWRRLARIAYRDPEHVAERLALFGSERLGDPSLEWASRVREERPEAPRAGIAEEVRVQTAQVARIDGAVSGTPFLLALVPGYLAYLWQEGVMERRIAALYGSDPRELETCARTLVLRGVHPTIEAAREGVRTVAETPLPDKPTKRRPLRTWVRSVYVLLIFGGFLSAPTEGAAKEGHWRLKAVGGFVVGGVIWVMTWVLPVTFMIVMAWACESHARSLGSRTLSFYGGESANAELAAGSLDADQDGGRTKRDLLRAGLLVLSIAIPIAFVAYADHVKQSTGVNWLGALGALVAVSIVIATTVIARRA